MSTIDLFAGKLETLPLGTSGVSGELTPSRLKTPRDNQFSTNANTKSAACTETRHIVVRSATAFDPSISQSLAVSRSREIPFVKSLKLKRALDILLASLALFMLAPFFAVIAILVKRDGGPVIYRQRRVGKDGVEFWFYKFRSMVVDADKVRVELEKLNQHGQTGVTFKMKNDPRVTRVGRILRKTSIDELPQFWNVLKGEMSLVGPRPALPTEVARYTLEQRRRLDVKPGLTCFWQIGGRSELPFEQQVRLDLKYIEERSLWLDLLLLVKTPPALILGSGAY